jgi:ABC-type Fe3+ transport system permease subunit
MNTLGQIAWQAARWSLTVALSAGLLAAACVILDFIAARKYRKSLFFYVGEWLLCRVALPALLVAAACGAVKSIAILWRS